MNSKSRHPERTAVARSWPPALALLLVIGLAGWAAAQGLAGAAAQEQERRARQAAKSSPAPAFTDGDLEAARIAREGPPKPSPSPGSKKAGTASPTPVATATPTPEPTAPAEPSLEPLWRARAATKRAAVATAQARLTEIEQQLASLRADREPTDLTDPNRLQKREAEIAKLLAVLPGAQQQLATAQQELIDFEQQARREGALPGWLREP